MTEGLNAVTTMKAATAAGQKLLCDCKIMDAGAIEARMAYEAGADDRQFCRSCGHPALFKITVKTNADGEIEYVMPRFKKNNIRGTTYSLPKMKMGRVDNIILTEDQKELHRPRKKDKSLNVFSDEFIAGDSPFKGTNKNVTAKKGIGMNNRANYGLQIGMGRRNPNASKRKTGNKKKK